METQAGRAPHIRSRNHGVLNNWIKTASTLPMIIAAAVFYGTAALTSLGICLVSALLAEILGRALAGGKASLYDGEAVLAAVLFTLILPPALPAWMAGTGIFAGVFLARECFGGAGQNIFNPVVTGYVFLVSTFPAAMNAWVRSFDFQDGVSALARLKMNPAGEPFLFSDLLWGKLPGPLGTTCAAAVLLSGLILLVQKQVRWQVPVIFLAVLAALSALGGQNIPVSLCSGITLAAAFYLVTDPVTIPHTLEGMGLWALSAAVLTVLIRCFSFYPDGTAFALLPAGVLTPWFDRMIRPAGLGHGGVS